MSADHKLLKTSELLYAYPKANDFTADNVRLLIASLSTPGEKKDAILSHLWDLGS
jgi:hypothetical protein